MGIVELHGHFLDVHGLRLLMIMWIGDLLVLMLVVVVVVLHVVHVHVRSLLFRCMLVLLVLIMVVHLRLDVRDVLLHVVQPVLHGFLQRHLRNLFLIIVLFLMSGTSCH